MSWIIESGGNYMSAKSSCIHTWNLVRSVLHTPVANIIATRNGTTALTAMVYDWCSEL
jgi:hypothetical protein